MPLNYSVERRTFLKTLALIGGAAASVPLTQEANAAEQPVLASSEKSGQGYRETEHISKYYQAARK